MNDDTECPVIPIVNMRKQTGLQLPPRPAARERLLLPRGQSASTRGQLGVGGHQGQEPSEDGPLTGLPSGDGWLWSESSERRTLGVMPV